MADPLSIISGTTSIADVCVRLIVFLNDVQAAAAAIDDDIRSLQSEIEALRGINSSIQTAFKQDLTTTPSPPHDFWTQTDKNVRNCLNVVEKLQKLLEGIYGTTGPKSTGPMDAFVKANRKRSKEKELRQCRESLATYIGALQISLQCTNMYVTLQLEVKPRLMRLATSIKNRTVAPLSRYLTSPKRFRPQELKCSSCKALSNRSRR
jgi:hypothetical protein